MPTKIIKCCVASCDAVGVHYHRFPNPKTDISRFNTWLDILNIRELRLLDPGTVYNNKRVCSIHFDAKYKSEGNPRLHYNAIPTMTVSDEPLPSTSTHQIVETTYPLEKAFDDVPSTSISEVSGRVTPERSTVQQQELLRKVGVSRQAHLTPIAKKLYRSALHWKKSAQSSKKSKLTFRRRLQLCEKYAESTLFEKMSVMTPAAKTFLNIQLRETKHKKQGRRFTQDEKILCLSLLKQSPKGYDLLHKMFTLPSRKTLNLFLGQMTLNTGINEQLFTTLKASIKKMKPIDRHCALMFDEVSLSPQLHYNQQADQIDGFVDNGKTRALEFADHALVFMVRGIVKQWKQAIAFTFCEGGTNAALLSTMLEEIISALQGIGLTVVCTVCDQAAANVSAVKKLISKTKEKYARNGQVYYQNHIEVNSVTVVPIFDVPHMLKGIRNNFIKRNISCSMNGTNFLGKWEHVEELYRQDQVESLGSLRLCPKLSERHVKLDHSSDKMKVKYCTQVLSQRVAATMNYLAKRNDINSDAQETARILLFLDELFDSLNNSSRNGVEGKPLTAAVSKESAHWKFWEDALHILNTMKFTKKDDISDKTCPPSIKNFITTIRGIKDIYGVMAKKGVDFLFMRNFNQDPLENFFGLIRSQGARNINPSCSSFIAAFKTLTINNFTAKHSIGANCEEDISEGALSTLKELLNLSVEPTVENEIYEEPEVLTGNEDHTTLIKSNYCAGFVVKNIKNVVGDCAACKSDLHAAKIGPQHGLIQAREYENTVARLVYPSFSANRAFATTANLVIAILNKNCNKKNIVKFIKQNVLQNVQFYFLSCPLHNNVLTEHIINKTVLLMLFHYIRETNNILNGKKKIINSENNILQYKAKIKYEKYHKIK
ncbi:thap domain-containing protein 9 [Holotrichia oblita]|uniref:Thap domain-containing protein 9 n=1 Tax=Holotrichia oblita TaxID=644536 RepID=A0ACB9TUU8_HOLOL|nr:thap domain-containing protein 9 [Holotrichia oblita]